MAKSAKFVTDVLALIRFWDHKKNTQNPAEVLVSSSKKVFWKCPSCNHEWENAPRHQNASTGKCPCCELGLVIKQGVNDLFTIIPEAKRYYDFEKNGDYDIYNHPVKSSLVKLWWKCPDCGYEWKSVSSTRIEGAYGNYKWKPCYKCGHDKSQKKISDVPFLMQKWNFEKNKNIKTDNLTTSSHVLAYWHCCRCGHDWREQIRTMDGNGGSCPACDRQSVLIRGKTDALTLVPGLVEFLKNKNDAKRLSEVTIKSNKVLEWKCPKCQREWKAGVATRVHAGEDNRYSVVGCSECGYKIARWTIPDSCKSLLCKHYSSQNTVPFSELWGKEAFSRGYYWICPDCKETFLATIDYVVSAFQGNKKCPYCKKKLVRRAESFAALHPELMDEYSPDNEIDPFAVFPGSTKTVKWVCRNNPTHIWEASFNSRHRKCNACPQCYPFRHTTRTSLAEQNPELASMWSSNNKNTIYGTNINTRAYYLWICPKCKREFSSRIEDMQSKEEPCPYCSGEKAIPGKTSLKALYPEIAKTYSDTNYVDADYVLPAKTTIYSWICEVCGREFRASVNKKVSGEATCPYCAERKIVPGVTSFAAKHPDLLEEWYLLGNYLIADPDKISDKSSELVWWRCKKNPKHIYRMSVADRLLFQKRRREPCLYCKGRRRKQSHFVKFDKRKNRKTES